MDYPANAHWMTVDKNGVPEYHGRRWTTIEYAQEKGITAYRMDVQSGRVDIVYDPETKQEYKPGERVVLQSYYDPKPGRYVREGDPEYVEED